MKLKFLISSLILLLILLIIGQSESITQAQSFENRNFLPVISNTLPPRWIGPPGGSAIALAVDSQNPKIAFAGTICGVYKSTNGGISWQSTGPGLCYMIDSLALDPTNPDIVYAGSHGGGVYKSTDGGANWTPMNTGIHANAVVYTMMVNPGNPDLVYAGTRGAPAAPGPPWGGVLYKSVNGGVSWSAVLTNIGGSSQQDWVYSIQANPNQPNYVIAASHEHGPFVSSDYGNAGTWSGQNSSVDGSGRAIAFDPRAWLQTAFYATWHRTGIYRSSNNGYNWSLSNSGLGEAKIYPNGIAIDLSDPDNIYLASFSDARHGVMKSTNAGSSWRLAGLGDKYIYSVASPGQGNNIVLAGAFTDGVYRSPDGGNNWYYSSNGITAININGIVASPPASYLVSLPGIGVYRSLDGGNTWFAINNGLADRNLNGLVAHPDNPNLVFALTSKAGVQRIDLSGGGGWTSAGFSAQVAREQLSLAPENGISLPQEPMVELLGHLPGESEEPGQTEPDLLAAKVTAPVLSLEFAPSNSAIAYLGTNGAGVYLSTDSGLSWEETGLKGTTIRGIAVHPTNDVVVYAGTSAAGRVKTSSNRGQGWVDLPLIPGSPSVYSVAISAAEPDAVYAGTANGVWKYAGSEWVQAGLAGYAVNVIKTNPANPAAMYAGTPSGAFVSYDRTQWSLVGLTAQIPVQMIQFSAKNSDASIFFATSNHGVLQLFKNP